MLGQELRDEYRQLVDRVAHGNELAASPKLQKFLVYVTECALEDHPEAATEQQIGVNVFGKRPGYNSSEDSIVRSQARLLRLKLASYFEHEGRDESVVVTIPKGQYLPLFLPRPHADAATADEHPHEGTEELPGSHAHVAGERASWRRMIWPLVGLLLFVVGIVAGISWRSLRAASLAWSNSLWRPFLTASEAPLVIYSNPTFLGDPFSGLRIRMSLSDEKPGGEVDETYTGTGEAEAIREITQFFDERGAAFLLKRTRLVTWDEARSRNLIFIGAPSQNTALQDLPATTNFRIRLNERNQGYIENTHPKAGEPARFQANGNTEEYAIVAFLPGTEPDKRVLVLSGLTTNGTQAATEYICSDAGAKQLIQLAGTANGVVKPFEAILHVRISQGVPIGVDLAYLHQR